MPTNRAVRSSALNKRILILTALAPYEPLDIDQFTCPVGMTCTGLARTTKLGESCVWNNVSWLKRNGYIRGLGKRRASPKDMNWRNRSTALVLTSKGRQALVEGSNEYDSLSRLTKAYRTMDVRYKEVL